MKNLLSVSLHRDPQSVSPGVEITDHGVVSPDSRLASAALASHHADAHFWQQIEADIADEILSDFNVVEAEKGIYVILDNEDLVSIELVSETDAHELQLREIMFEAGSHLDLSSLPPEMKHLSASVSPQMLPSSAAHLLTDTSGDSISAFTTLHDLSPLTEPIDY